MQTIYLDISNKGVVPTVYAKQGEVGRKFTAVLTDAGVPYVLDESDLLSAWYEGTSGIGNYTTVGENSAFTVDENKVTIELITQMLTNDGDGVLSVSINKTDGSEIATWNIPYLVEKKPGVDSPEAEAFYTAFSEIAGQVADSANRAEEAAKNLENITPESIGARPNTWTPTAEEVGAIPVINWNNTGCYYRESGGVVEWINPPFHLNEEYRTIERYAGLPVYVKAAELDLSPAGSKFIHVYASILNVVSIDGSVKNKDNSMINPISSYTASIAMNMYGNFVWNVTENSVAHVIIKYTK